MKIQLHFEFYGLDSVLQTFPKLYETDTQSEKLRCNVYRSEGCNYLFQSMAFINT